MANNQQLAGTTQQLSLPGVINTINPLSQFAGGKDYVPDWLVNFFDKDKGLNAQRAAHLTSKIVSGGIATALGVFAVRSLLHNIQLDKFNKASMSPTDDVDEVYRHAPQRLMQSKHAALNKDAFTTDYNFYAGAVPSASAALIAIAVASMADKLYDNKVSEQLDASISDRKHKLNNIILDRAQLNRLGKIQKHASQGQPQSRIFSAKTERAIGLLTAALMIGTGIAGFKYQRATDPNNIKLEAATKGIQRYIKARAQQNYVRSKPADSQLAKLLDSNLQASAPELSGDQLNKEIDI